MQSECPHCGYDFEVFDRLAGRRVKCPRCGERFRARAVEGKSAGKSAPKSTDRPSEAKGASGATGHFLTRDVGVIVFGLVAVCAILGALGWRMYVDHQRRVAQQAIKNEAWAAKEAGDQFLQRKEYVKAREQYLAARALMEELEVRDRKLDRTLKAVMQTDEMKYLGQGMVHFRGRWMPAEEKAATMAEEKGLVEFEGEWVTPEEKAKLEAEKEKAEAAARLTREEAALRGEAKKQGIQVVTAFLRFAQEKAPAEAAERYMTALTGDPMEYPRIVYDFTIDDEVTYVAQDTERKHPDVSATYCGVKAYVTIGTAVGQERVVWNFQVRKVASEWKITYAKKKEVPQLTPPTPAPAAREPAPAEGP